MRNKSNASANDRRASSRYRVRNDGRLLFVDRPCFADCTIRNISEDGALLSLMGFVSLPLLVLLWEQRTGTIHECEVRWRSGCTVGVQFTDVWGRAARRAALEKGLAALKHARADPSSLH